MSKETSETVFILQVRTPMTGDFWSDFSSFEDLEIAKQSFLESLVSDSDISPNSGFLFRGGLKKRDCAWRLIQRTVAEKVLETLLAETVDQSCFFDEGD